MKVLIVNPVWSFQNYPPLNLVELASYLIGNGFKNTKILDLNFEIKNKFKVDNLIEESRKKILKEKPDAVCITCNAVQFPFVCELSRELKSRTKIPVVIGGVMPSLGAESVLKLTQADFAVRGEGELTLTELLTGIKNKKNLKRIKGLSYIDKNGKPKNNSERELLDLNCLPEPRFDLISENLKNNKNVWLTASRGCAYKCGFCSGNAIWKYQRRKNIDSIIKQLLALKKKYGVKNFIFGDDCLTLNKEWIKELCGKMIPLKLKWGCLARIDSIDEEILACLKKAGCGSIYHGIESGSAAVRKNLDKNIKDNDNKKIFGAVKKELEYGFKVTCSFMSGIPFETKKDIMQTFNFAKKLQKTGAAIQLWLLTPYYGLKILKEYKKQVVETDRTKYNLQKDIFHNAQMFLYSRFIDKYKKYNPDNFIFLPQDMRFEQFVKLFCNIHKKLGLDKNKKKLTEKEVFILKTVLAKNE
ncbi:MAG: radical SAM protein [Endomicrobiaceae bacterium]|nr:radical SAM protein [Endomicrobiaceae bacterium]